MNNLLNRLTLAMALGVALPVIAQPSNPAPPEASSQPLRYQSAFADYKPWQDIKAGEWRRLNDNLAAKAGTAGGHAGHGSAAPATPAQPPASQPAAPAHPGHHMQGGKQ